MVASLQPLPSDGLLISCADSLCLTYSGRTPFIGGSDISCLSRLFPCKEAYTSCCASLLSVTTPLPSFCQKGLHCDHHSYTYCSWFQCLHRLDTHERLFIPGSGNALDEEIEDEANCTTSPILSLPRRRVCRSGGGYILASFTTTYVVCAAFLLLWSYDG